MSRTSPVVVDTDVVSFVFKNHPFASYYHVILADRPLCVSLITVAEIEYGMESKNWGLQRRELMRRFLDRFSILLPDAGTPGVWARVKNGCERKGRPITFADAWIAANAVQHGMSLVTHNASDYEAIEGLPLLTAPVSR